MDAIEVDEAAFVDPDRCIGCGVCVSACPAEAMMYRQKEADVQYVPPENTAETYMRMAQERGLI